MGGRRATRLERVRARRRRERWARRFRPDPVETLLIAEAPPGSLDRYFYFPDVQVHDSLYWETAKAFGVGPTRAKKVTALRELQALGVFMIDATLEPIEDRLRVDIGRLLARVLRLKPRRIVIVKAAVYDQIYQRLADAGLPIVSERIPFPGSGQQRRFHEGMRRALRSEPATRRSTPAPTGRRGDLTGVAGGNGRPEVVEPLAQSPVKEHA